MKHLRDWNVQDAESHLKEIDLVSCSVLRLEQAGDGNMNCTKRVSLENGDSLILKQSSSFCEKFPSIAAPIERLREENTFYRIAKKNKNLEGFFPRILHYDEENFLMVMEDLGTGGDFSYLYKTNEKITESDLLSVVKILSEIHKTEVLASEKMSNLSMRKLNHAHIFQIPFDKNNEIDLDSITPGLKSLGRKMIGNDFFQKLSQEMGRCYLQDGKFLLHGDYYPGSWLKTARGIFVIDPEFGFLGEKEFDLGVLYAHLFLSGHDEDESSFALQNYTEDFDKDLMRKYAGIEIIRRLLGVAQLPINYSLQEKERLLLVANGLCAN